MGKQKPSLHTVVSVARHYYKQICMYVPCLETEVSPFYTVRDIFLSYRKRSAWDGQCDWRHVGMEDVLLLAWVWIKAW